MTAITTMTHRARVEPRRLLRALTLEVEDLGDGVHHVTGGRERHTVLVTSQMWACDCVDSTMQPLQFCKHRLAVYLTRQLAAPVRAALVAALPQRRPA